MNGLRKPPTDSELRGSFLGEESPGVSEMLKRPYPGEYESRHFFGSSSAILVRPIKKDDALLLVKFFRSLSPRTVFLRFLANLQDLPLEWVKQFTDIDYDRDVAMVALEETDLEDSIIGVCRIMRKPGSTRGELAVVVADAWQERGIGTLLMERSIHIAGELGMRSLWALVSAENDRVISLAEKFGFRLKEVSESGHGELEMEL